MREVFISDLVKEVLGPRNGIFECVTGDSPLNGYITGVLSPKLDSPDQVDSKIDNEATNLANELGRRYEDDQDEAGIDVPPVFSPTLDPKSRSSTMGMSFVVASETKPEAEVCVTWARYALSLNDSGEKSWRRIPKFFIKHLDLSRSYSVSCRSMIEQDSSSDEKGSDEAELSIVSRRISDKSFFITIHLINRVSIEEDKIAEAQHHIFQPQIRVLLSQDTRLTEGLKKTTKNFEDELFNVMYENDPVFVRGHMCSALWKEIDPEVRMESPPPYLDYPECIDLSPFKWIDGDILPDKERKRFSAADVRTEFVPIYSMAMPVFAWSDESGKPPELNAESLAEDFDPVRMEKALKPFIFGYNRWIDLLENKVQLMEPRKKVIANSVIRECRTVLQRIDDGINLLLKDEDARLCFCFANKAMNTQSNWLPRKRNLKWHPFQLAFILTTLESIANPDSQFRNACDLLWVPTGGGKTEAYLGIMAFTVSYRRIKSLKNTVTDITGAGISVITRYTLRLLTIQQFRRTLSLIAACESLRVWGLNAKSEHIGWRPAACQREDNFLWGSIQFGIGLWVGGEVTPNKLDTTFKIENGKKIPRPGAMDILRNKNRSRSNAGEPAQILRCPACETILAIPEMGLQSGEHIIHVTVRSNDSDVIAKVSTVGDIHNGNVLVKKIECFKNFNDHYTISITITSQDNISSDNVDGLYKKLEDKLRENNCIVKEQCARPSRPGYFLREYINDKNNLVSFDFNLYCPNPYLEQDRTCPLRQRWCAGAPTGLVHGTRPDVNGIPREAGSGFFPDNNSFVHVITPFQKDSPFLSDRIPIPAFTVDEQIYRWLPTIVVATADKFARFPYEPLCASLTGNIDHYHCIHGFYRKFQHTSDNKKEHPSPNGRAGNQNFREISPIRAPDLIIQDELHLIDGPLGSLAGLYETAIDFLCTRKSPIKYIASTATIKRAEEQIGALFGRRLQLFPPHGLNIRDRFFIREKGTKFLEDDPPGRLYLGICCPGRGPLTPIVRIWSRLLQTAYENRESIKADRFWTLTGFFNSVRELSGARALYRQDIPQQLDRVFGNRFRRELSEGNALELSSRIDSTNLPSILDILNRRFPEAEAVDTLFTTSMFGTGVDISRIGLMVVNGQPKTTSAYIQASGRVGRNNGALVVVFYRATRPRDLSHYEFFGGYHRQLHKFVEPVTVYPFAGGVLDRALGPVAVSILRNMRNPGIPWGQEITAPYMASHRNTSDEVRLLPSIFEKRAQAQPVFRRPNRGDVEEDTKQKLDMWHSVAGLHNDLKYVEYVMSKDPQFPVVLGDNYHRHHRKSIVYGNAPQSLRDVEETTGFEI